MARKKNDDHIRTITKVAGGKSYCITLPIKIVREMNWESQQKVLVRRRGNKVIIIDQGANGDSEKSIKAPKKTGNKQGPTAEE